MLSSSLVQVLNDMDPKAPLENLGAPHPDPVELSKSLHKTILKLKSEFLSGDGTPPNYPLLRATPDFANFQRDCQQLRLVDLGKLDRKNNEDYPSSSKAFFINIYNTLTIHALAEKVTTERTLLELENFWQKYAYRIGTHIFSLDDIEHGVLRCNKLHPTFQDYFFKEGDPRRDFVLPLLDPRIHFALNCGAVSCPAIRLYSADNLEHGLDLAAKNFCQSDIAIDEQEKYVILSKIFFWYAGDFGEDEKSVVQVIAKYLSPEQRIQLENLHGQFSVKYADYDWNIH